jgi:hypothetical protein
MEEQSHLFTLGEQFPYSEIVFGVLANSFSGRAEPTRSIEVGINSPRPRLAEALVDPHPMVELHFPN